MKKTESDVLNQALQTERLSDGRRKLLREFNLKIDDEFFAIEKDFETDYSSIPWFGRFVVHWSKVDIAGVIHDWLYKFGKIDGTAITRSYADRVWRKTAKSGSHHANGVQAWICWISLRLFGFIVWRRYRKEQDLEN